MTICCRICLAKKVQKDVSELKSIAEIDKNHQDIMLFCLDIHVSEDPLVSRSLCNKCYKKVISFYIFKLQAINNDAYLRSLHATEEVKDINIQDQKINDLFKVEESEVKIEADYDDYQLDQSELDLHELMLNVKAEDTEKIDSDNEALSIFKTNKENSAKNENCKIPLEPPQKKRGPKKKVIVEGPKLQVCELCGKSFIYLKEHMERHKDPADRRTYPCKNCPKIFNSYGARFKHNKAKHLMIRDKCTICDKHFSDLTTHTLMMHNREKLRLICIICDKRFKSQSLLDLHFRGHTKDKPFQCDLCNRKYHSKGLLVSHIRSVHDQERSHMCHLCPKSFFKKYSLQIHLRSHTKERPYTCDECGKQFYTRCQMLNHVQIHTGVKTVACALCDMKFYRQSALSVHMLTHTKEKRHPCQYCGVQFGRTDHRNRHERSAHGHDRTHGAEHT